eukprot:m.70646 g.70646  ORF g.70646 m.70646 type:complete len:237 (+) comp13784_c1_seq3:562-1272(+)
MQYVETAFRLYAFFNIYFDSFVSPFSFKNIYKILYLLCFTQPKADLPPVRRSGKISISFSHRAFKTPERETYKEQEQEWLDKQAAARKAIADAKERQGGSIEHDPLWYTDKGREFFRNGDIQSAINAFTSAVALDPESSLAYSLRAACHLKAADFHACAADSSKALSLLTPPCPANADERLKAHLRRAASLEMLEDFESALFDYRKAAELRPADDSIQQHIHRLCTRDEQGHAEQQ